MAMASAVWSHNWCWEIHYLLLSMMHCHVGETVSCLLIFLSALVHGAHCLSLNASLTLMWNNKGKLKHIHVLSRCFMCMYMNYILE